MRASVRAGAILKSSSVREILSVQRNRQCSVRMYVTYRNDRGIVHGAALLSLWHGHILYEAHTLIAFNCSSSSVCVPL